MHVVPSAAGDTIGPDPKSPTRPTARLFVSMVITCTGSRMPEVVASHASLPEPNWNMTKPRRHLVCRGG
jgi:hypothetical protein